MAHHACSSGWKRLIIYLIDAKTNMRHWAVSTAVEVQDDGFLPGLAKRALGWLDYARSWTDLLASLLSGCDRTRLRSAIYPSIVEAARNGNACQAQKCDRSLLGQRLPSRSLTPADIVVRTSATTLASVRHLDSLDAASPAQYRRVPSS